MKWRSVRDDKPVCDGLLMAEKLREGECKVFLLCREHDMEVVVRTKADSRNLCFHAPGSVRPRDHV